jgi:methionyl-tRNA synthetase
MARIFIGVAWPYANGPYHLGHLAGAILPADEFARFHRLRGEEVLMVSGSDMHGTPVTFRADTEGVSPQSVAERFDAVHRDSNRRLGISFDLYTHTHTPLHQREAQDFFLLLLRGGYVDRRTADAPYCPRQSRFLPDRYLRGTCPHCGYDKARGDECENCGRVFETRELGSPHCSLCGGPVEFRPSEHFYLRLDLLSAELDRYLADKSYWRDNVRKFTENFRAGGLRPTPITRDLDWGVPIPLDGYAGKVFYVWFEAVIGYLSASKEWARESGGSEAWRPYWDPAGPVRSYYFIGKDNIFHHTLFWPGMLLGRGTLALPYDVPANEWLVIGGAKLSKSALAAGGVSTESVEIPSLLEKWPADVIRFYAALRAPQHHDTEYSPEEFASLASEVLAHQWGNLVQRLLVLAREQGEGKVPAPPEGWSPSASSIGRRIVEAHRKIGEEYSAVRLKEALELALGEVREANRWVQESKPWSAPAPARDTVLYEGLWFLRAASIWLAPVLPHSSESVQRMLGLASPLERGSWDLALEPLPPGQRLGTIAPLFPTSDEPARAPAPRASPAVAGGPSAPPEPSLDLRAAVVTSVAEIPGADKLYRLEVDLGPLGTRTVVAGLKPYLRIDELQGRRIVLLANLEPRRIRSITSNGMLLAAESDGHVYPIRPPAGSPPGTPLAGAGPELPRLSYDQFTAGPLLVGAVSVAGDSSSRVDVGGREVEVPGRWEPGLRVVVRTGGPEDRATVLTLEPGGALEVDPVVPPGTRVR